MASTFLTPNDTITPRQRSLVAAAWVALALVAWEAYRSPVFPSVGDIARAFPTLWHRDGLGPALLSSFRVNVEALLLSTAVSLPVIYLCRTPAFAPVATAVATLRFLSPSVFFLILLFAAPSAHMVKVLMLAAGEAFFLVTTMATIVQNIPLARFDDARTLRMDEWRVTFFVVVRGTLADLLDAVRDNAAMAWPMLMMVEGFVRSEGGVGVLLLTQEKYMRFEAVYAIAIAILVVGALQDAGLRAMRRFICPYAELR